MVEVEGDEDPKTPHPEPGQWLAQLEAEHWRRLATQRDAQWRMLAHRPSIRVVLRLDRLLTPAMRAVVGRGQRVRSAADEVAVRVWGLRGLTAARRRKAALGRVASDLSPAATDRRISVITFVGEPAEQWETAAAGAAVEVIAVAQPGATNHPKLVPAQNDQASAYTEAIARGVALATGDVLCFVPDCVEAPAPGWLARLANAIDLEHVAATPTVVRAPRGRWWRTEHDLLVRSEGLGIELDRSGAPRVVALAAGDVPAVGGTPTEVFAGPMRCLAVSRSALVAAGGLHSTDIEDVAAIDLCIRLRRQGGQVRHVPDAVVLDDRPVPSRTALRRPIDANSASWRSLVERYGASIARAADGGGLARPERWVITTAAPSSRVANRWGDWHLAEGLARALQQLGAEVTVQTLDRADSLATRAADIHLVLHGLAPVRPTPGQRHILWVISHPESVESAECDAADLIVVASHRFAQELRHRTQTPVEILLQATDPDRFSPQPPQPEHSHPVTVVAKTRDVLRPAVAAALQAGLRPAIYGGGWRELVDADLVVAEHIDNRSLATIYSSAGVVLNDHWDTMRAWGFVSNRIFDVLACETPLISDHLDELGELFGDAVATFETSDELGACVRAILNDPHAARQRAAAARATILTHHTFGHRADRLLELMRRYGLDAPPS